MLWNSLFQDRYYQSPIMVLRTHSDTPAYVHVGVLLKAPQMLCS